MATFGSLPATRDLMLERLADTGPFGFGASSLGNLYKIVADETTRATVDACWDAGVRLYDTAPFYGFGLSERRLGDALRGRDRDAYLLSTKVGRLLVPGTAEDKLGYRSPMPFDPVYDYSYDGVMRSFEASLQRLGLARIDILYMHDIGRATHGADHDRQFAIAMDGGYRAMAELRDSGSVGAIGLGVNETEICNDSFRYADFDLFMVAGRHTLLNQQSLDFLDTCRSRGVGIVAAGVFNSGILATGTSGTEHPFYDYAAADDGVMRRVARLESVCARFDVPLAAVALRFATAHPSIVAMVIGTASPARIRETVSLIDIAIPDALWDHLRDAGLISPRVMIP